MFGSVRAWCGVAVLLGLLINLTGCGGDGRPETPEVYLIEVTHGGDHYRLRGRTMDFVRLEAWLAEDLERKERARILDTHRVVVRIRGVNGSNDPQAIRLVRMCQNMGVNRVLIE